MGASMPTRPSQESTRIADATGLSEEPPYLAEVTRRQSVHLSGPASVPAMRLI